MKTQKMTQRQNRPYGLDFTDTESMTQQEFKEECDIKNILRQHEAGDIQFHVAQGLLHYGDYTEVNEFKEAMDIITQATSDFNKLPSHIQEFFDYNAGKCLEFVGNPDNKKEAMDMGLLPPEIDFSAYENPIKKEVDDIKKEEGVTDSKKSI